MWWKIELDKDGSVKTVEQVEACDERPTALLLGALFLVAGCDQPTSSTATTPEKATSDADLHFPHAAGFYACAVNAPIAIWS